jgi:hypothetical protein
MGFLEMALRAAEQMKEGELRREPTTKTTKARSVPEIPEGVCLLVWNPKPAPVLLTSASVVTEVDQFIADTLARLGAALHSKQGQATHREVRELVDRLEQCGVVVRVRLNDRITGSEKCST